MKKGKLPPSVEQLFRSAQRNISQDPPDEAQLHELLVEMSKEFETMYIVVDALDELKGSEIKVNRRPPFLSELQKLRTSSQCPISVLVTSRPGFYDIQEYSATSHKLEIKPDFSDIEEYAMTTAG